MTTSPALERIYAADRELRAAEIELMREGDGLTKLLADAVADAKKLDEGEERHMRLERLSDLCAQVPGPEMADA